MISEKALQEFQRLYQARYGVALSRSEALAHGTQLVQLAAWLLKPQPQNTKQEFSEHRNSDKEDCTQIDSK